MNVIDPAVLATGVHQISASIATHGLKIQLEYAEWIAYQSNHAIMVQPVFGMTARIALAARMVTLFRVLFV